MGGASRNEAEIVEHNEDFELLSKYAYSDLTVYMRVGENSYLNITDYSVTEKENERITLQSDSPFVIMFCSFFYTAFGRKAQPYVCDVTFDELLELSGISDKKFKHWFASKFGKENKEILAILCAKKLLDYQCGKIVKESNHKYGFYRQEYAKEMGKYKKRKRLVFTKDLYAA